WTAWWVHACSPAARASSPARPRAESSMRWAPWSRSSSRDRGSCSSCMTAVCRISARCTTTSGSTRRWAPIPRHSQPRQRLWPAPPVVAEPQSVSPMEPLRLLVVGAGAKALFALEELAARLAEHRTRPGEHAAPAAGPLLEITVVDPGEHPGTGAAYHPDQPHHLRLNVDSRILDAPAVGSLPSFRDWARTTHPG